MKNNNETVKPIAPNARFWTWENDAWVKLTIRPGQTLQWGKRSRDDEGYSFESCGWENTGYGVQLTWARGGRDCDGYSETAGELFAEFETLRACAAGYDDTDRANYFGGVRIMRPEWRKVGAVRCRDDFAAAAGY